MELYGIANESKGHKVSSIWPSPPSIEQMKELIKEFDWSGDDYILCYSCRNSYVFLDGSWLDNSKLTEEQKNIIDSKELFFGGWTRTGEKKGIPFSDKLFACCLKGECAICN